MLWKMYERKLTDAPNKLIKNGKPQFGSFNTPPKFLDIKGVKEPFGILPLPTFITNLRIRSNISFVFSTEQYYGTIDILDSKIYGFLEVNVWEKATLKRYTYKKIMFLSRRLVPKNLEKASCNTSLTRLIRLKKRDVTFYWNKERNKFKIDFYFKGDNVRPNLAGSFSIDSWSQKPSLTSVLPAPVMRRCYASYQQPISLNGGLCVTKGKMLPFYDFSNKAESLFVLTRAYYTARTINNLIAGIGKVGEDQITFRIADMSILPPDKNTYNDNVLFVNNEMTLLPPVTVTPPYGMSKKWIIQDTENMVDLDFTPKSTSQRLISLVLLHAQYFTVYGTFEGKIVTKDGKSITLKDFPGIIKNQRIRL